MRLRRRLLATLCAGLMAIGALSTPTAGAGSGSGTPPGWPDGASVEVKLLRGQERSRRAALRVVNGSGRDLLVTSARLSSPYFTAVPVNTATVSIPNGRTIDVFADLGSAVCPAPAGSTTARFGLRSGGVDHVADVALDDHPLAERNRRECTERYVNDRVAVVFGTNFEIDGATAHTSLELTRRRGDDAISIDYVRGTVTMAIAAGDDSSPVATIPSTAPRASVAVDVWVARCDDHAVIESRRNYEFRVWVSVGEARRQRLIVKVPDGSDLWHALEQLMHDCQQGDATSTSRGEAGFARVRAGS